MNHDKKKVIVLGVLGLALLAVGVFQFTSGGEEPASKPKSTASASEPNAEAGAPNGEAPPAATAGANGEELSAENGATEEDPLRQLYVSKLPSRDPFEGAGVVFERDPNQADPAPQPQPSVRRSSPRPVPPLQIGGDFQGLPGASMSVDPAAPLPNVNQFGYRLSGIILGTKPAAVFTDEGGNQKLVTLGSSVDGDSQLTGVAQGKATVRHRGKTVTLTVGGTPNAN